MTWSMNPQKLADFTKNKLLPDESKKYLHHLISREMPASLKKYMELTLFPRIQMKVVGGISLQTACCWLHKEGFWYMVHKNVTFGLHSHRYIGLPRFLFPFTPYTEAHVR